MLVLSFTIFHTFKFSYVYCLLPSFFSTSSYHKELVSLHVRTVPEILFRKLSGFASIIELVTHFSGNKVVFLKGDHVLIMHFIIKAKETELSCYPHWSSDLEEIKFITILLYFCNYLETVTNMLKLRMSGCFFVVVVFSNIYLRVLIS